MSESRVDIARHRIQSFNATNYSLWSKNMQLLLRDKGLWGVLSDDEIEPPCETQKKDYRAFVHWRDVALTDILLSTENSCNHSVINLDDLKSVWDKLHEMCKNASGSCIHTCLLRMQNLNMENNEKVMSHVNGLASLQNNCVAISH